MKTQIIDFVKTLSKTPALQTYDELHLVFGAEGHRFFIEISKGRFATRDLLANIHIQIEHQYEPKRETLELPELSDDDKRYEFTLTLPTPAHTIFFLNQLEEILNKKTIILPAMNGSGDRL